MDFEVQYKGTWKPSPGFPYKPGTSMLYWAGFEVQEFTGRLNHSFLGSSRSVATTTLSRSDVMEAKQNSIPRYMTHVSYEQSFSFQAVYDHWGGSQTAQLIWAGLQTW